MFHETRFPTAISRAAHGGPERRTDVVVLGSGAEERNARWADSRRSWNAGYGIKSLDDLHAVIAFFEERRGRLIGFRWRDPMDFKSCPPEATPTALDQLIGTGDGATAIFQLTKTYGAAFNPWVRAIRKPVAGTVLIGVAGVTQTPATDYAIDHTREKAVFSVFKRSGEMPLFRIEKNPKLAAKQGAYSVINTNGTILKRGHELNQVLKVFDKALKLVDK